MNAAGVWTLPAVAAGARPRRLKESIDIHMDRMTGGSARDARSRLLRQAYEGEITGEAMFRRLGDFAKSDHQKRTAVLLADLESVTGDELLPVLTRRGVPFDRDSAWRAGEALTRKIIAGGWVKYFERILPMGEEALADMRTLHEMSDELDRMATARLVAHEEAFLDFVRRELAGAPDSLEPLVRYLEG